MSPHEEGKEMEQSLLDLGKQICEYDLSTSTGGVSPSPSVDSGSDSCRQPVSVFSAGDASVVSENVSSQQTMSDGNPPVVDVSTLYGPDIVSDCSCASDVNGNQEISFIVDPVLSFIKAFHLKGDNETLRNVLWSTLIVLMLKKQRSYCGRLVKVYCLGLDLSSIFVYMDSYRRSQLSAIIDDLLQAFRHLDLIDI